MSTHLLAADTIRRCLVADRGHLIVSADYDQVELRIAAALAGEESLIQAARDGVSLHQVTAIKLFGEDYTPDQYRYTKNANFGWLYGGGAPTLAEQVGIPLSAAANIISTYTVEMPALVAYRKRNARQVIERALNYAERQRLRALQSRMYAYKPGKEREQLQREITRLCRDKLGYVITPFGRRILVEADKAYRATNYIVQSAATDVLSDALVRLMRDPELQPTVLLPVHDEVIGQAPRQTAKRIARRYGEVMSTSMNGVPLTASGKVYGKSWGHGYRK